MPETLEDLILTQKPTAERPLLGLMVLVVEDSRFACEALRLMCQMSGARLRRAESLASAARHLAAYRPQVVVVDLGLPDGCGLDLIRELASAENRIEAILATSGDDGCEEEARAAGADAFLSKPLTSVAAFQSTVLESLHMASPPVKADAKINPDRLALKDDLTRARRLIGECKGSPRGYISSFLRSLGRSADDAEILEIAKEAEAGEAGLDARLAKRIGALRAG